MVGICSRRTRSSGSYRIRRGCRNRARARPEDDSFSSNLSEKVFVRGMSILQFQVFPASRRGCHRARKLCPRPHAAFDLRPASLRTADSARNIRNARVSQKLSGCERGGRNRDQPWTRSPDGPAASFRTIADVCLGSWRRQRQIAAGNLGNAANLRRSRQISTRPSSVGVVSRSRAMTSGAETGFSHPQPLPRHGKHVPALAA